MIECLKNTANNEYHERDGSNENIIKLSSFSIKFDPLENQKQFLKIGIFAPSPSTVPKKVTKNIGKIHKVSLPRQ